MYKKILTLFDNLPVFKKFISVLQSEKFTESEFAFGVGPNTKSEDFRIYKNMTIMNLNLRDKNDIEMVCNNFDLVLSVHSKQIFQKKLLKKLNALTFIQGIIQ